jgi:transposase
MGEVSTIGLDIAKSVFQVHGVDSDGAVVIRKRLAVQRFWSSFRPCGPAWLALKPARAHIIGAVGFRRSVTR